MRADLVGELREWIGRKRQAFSGTAAEFVAEPLFNVPASLLRILNRDLKAQAFRRLTNGAALSMFTPCE